MQKSTDPAPRECRAGDFVSLVGDDVSSITPHASAPAGAIVDLLTAERSRNAALPVAEQIVRARDLLEAAGLGHLRPDKAWRPRSWQDRLAALGEPEDLVVDKVAEAIYAANWRAPAPVWRTAGDEHKDWSRRQACAALALLRSLDRGAR